MQIGKGFIFVLWDEKMCCCSNDMFLFFVALYLNQGTERTEGNGCAAGYECLLWKTNK